jgi:uncharacterized membrane protein YhhN
VGVALALDTPDDVRRVWFVVALVFSLAGDVFLMLPRKRFVEGLASFLVAHVCYVVGFLVDAPHRITPLVTIVVALVIGVIAAQPLLRGLRGGDDRALLPPVVAYMGVISVMVGAASSTGLVLAIAGALLFWVSDYLIGYDRFVTRLAWAPVAIMVTYHLGQTGLVLSLVR